MADDAAVQPAAAAAAVAVAAEAEEEGAKKVCLVTGASSGIGRATAILFAEAGYRVIAASRDTEALNEVCQIIGDAGGDAEAVALDLTSNESCRNAADFAVRTFGRIDCLVNSGGVIRGGAADAIDVDNFDFNMSVNTRGAFCIMAACIPHLKKTKGNVVHVSCRLDSSKRTCVSHRRGKLAHFPHLLRGVCVCVSGVERDRTAKFRWVPELLLFQGGRGHDGEVCGGGLGPARRASQLGQPWRDCHQLAPTRRHGSGVLRQVSRALEGHAPNWVRSTM